MPYSIRQVKGGVKVVSPNHPQGFSKKPLSMRNAKEQLRVIYSQTGGK